MKLYFSLKLGIGVFLFFSLLLAGMLLWIPVRIRYHTSLFQSDDILRQVRGVDGLLSIGEKGREALRNLFPERAEAYNLLVEFWKNPGADQILNAEKSIHESKVLEAAYKNYETAARLMIAKLGYFKPEHAKTFYDFGKGEGDAGDYDTAIAYFTLAIILKPDYAEAYNNRGIRKDDMEEYEGAIADYDKAIKLNPKFVKAYSNRGVSKRHMGDLDGAIEDYTKALELDPENIIALENRINVYREKKDLDNLARDYTAKAKLQPEDVWVWRQRAYVYFDLERLDEAQVDYENSISMGDPYDHQNLYSFFRIMLVKLRKGEFDRIRWDTKKLLSGWNEDTNDGWTKIVARFFAGELKEEEFIKLAETEAGRTLLQQRCEAYYYAAEYRLASGDIEGAKKLYKKCVETEVTDYTEHRSSIFSLKRLEWPEKSANTGDASTSKNKEP
ncbi:MAG: tetratricopeptide repeat protein [Planctomycetota bacterium]|jgi:tetratricopeptide (TPR) repeat protein